MNKIVSKYCEDVLAGRRVAGKLEELAVIRHLNDLENATDRGLYFDHKAGQEPIDFIQNLRHHKGAMARKPLLLEPHQQFYMYSLYGWKNTDDGTRRFRKAYKEISRKNGKTTEVAGKALYMAHMEGEEGAQIYFVATKEDQARIGFNDATQIIKKTPFASNHFETYIKSIYVPSTSSFIKPLGSDSNTQDGFDPSYGIIDEYHAHKNDGMVGVIQSGMGARRQPLIDIITTAGFNKTFPCYGFRKLIKDIMEGTVENDNIFGLIFSMDETDEWEDESMWIKSNPNWGVSVYPRNIRGEYLEAKQKGGETEVNFKTKNLNIWTDAAKTWISTELWDASGTSFKELEMYNRLCYGGLDLASTEDFCAFTLFFPLGNNKFKNLTWFWIPEDTVTRRIKQGLSSLQEWIKQGFVFIVPGNTIDYDYIERFIIQCKDKFDIHSIAYDRWNSSALVIHLINEGIEMSPFGQGYASMSLPTKHFKTLVMQARLDHGNNPVLRWQRGNVVITEDPAENQKPDKKKSEEKIDGIVASIMALGQQITTEGMESTYERNGLLIL